MMDTEKPKQKPLQRKTALKRKTGLKQRTPLVARKTIRSRPGPKPTTTSVPSKRITRRKKEARKPTVARLKKEADSYFSKYIRLRDSDQYGLATCITCPTTVHWKMIQNGHFVGRRVSTLRYDEENCNAQCIGCNMFKSGEQYAYSLAIDLKYGEGKAKELHSRRFETHKFTTQELEEIIHDSKEQIAFYEARLLT